MRENIFSLFIFFALFLLVSCHKDNPVIPSGRAVILSIDRDTLSVGDTLRLSGEFLGTPNKNLYLMLDSMVKVESHNCIVWNNNEIQFVIPNGSKSGMIRYVSEDDAIDSIEVGINPVPYLEIIEIPAGTYIRGSNLSSLNEQPATEVTISNPFLMSKYEITQRMYKAVTGTNPSRVTGIELPVENVTWINAVQFCNELSKLNGLEEVYTITGVDAVADFSKNGWRLPTEAEWEYACKAGTNGDFAGSGIIGEMAWYGDNSGLKMHPPGRKNPNQFGLYDMHGNVWEWCWDYYDPDYYSEGMTIDPVGPSNGERRVLRGGSWNDGMNFSRSSNRTLPANIIGNNGIRPVRIK